MKNASHYGESGEVEGSMTKGGAVSVPVEKDTMLRLVKEQGYVPPSCYLDGMLVFSLVKAGEDPCRGCRGKRLVCGGRQHKSD